MLRKLIHSIALYNLAAAIAVGGFSSAQGAITDVYNTGVDALHVPLLPFANDQNYDLIVTGDPNCPTGLDPVRNDFVGVWVNSNNAISGWIRPNYMDASGTPPNPALWNCANGTYVYRTTFTLGTPAEVATASITGQVAADDQLFDIRLNGSSVPSPSANFSDLHAVRNSHRIAVRSRA